MKQAKWVAQQHAYSPAQVSCLKSNSYYALLPRIKNIHLKTLFSRQSLTESRGTRLSRLHTNFNQGCRGPVIIFSIITRPLILHLKFGCNSGRIEHLRVANEIVNRFHLRLSKSLLPDRLYIRIFVCWASAVHWLKAEESWTSFLVLFKNRKKYNYKNYNNRIQFNKGQLLTFVAFTRPSIHMCFH